MYQLSQSFVGTESWVDGEVAKMKLEELMLERWLQWQLDGLSMWVRLIDLNENFVWMTAPDVRQLCNKLKNY